MSQQVNLFNPIFLRQKKYFSVATMLQSLAIILLGVAVFYAYALLQVRDVENKLASAKRQLKLDEARLERVSKEFPSLKADAALTAEVNALRRQTAEREALYELARDTRVGEVRGISAYLRAFARHRMEGLWLTNMEIGAESGQIVLTGRAVSPEVIPVYLQQLEQEDVLRGKKFAALDMKQQSLPTGKTGKVEVMDFSLRSAASANSQ